MEARALARELRQELIGLMRGSLTEPNQYALDLMRQYYKDDNPSNIVDIRNNSCPGGVTSDACLEYFYLMDSQREERLNKILYPILGAGAAAIAIPVIIYGGGGAAIVEGGALVSSIYRGLTAARVATTAYEGTAAVRVVSTVGGSVSNSTRALYGSSAITSPQLWGLTANEWGAVSTGVLASYYSVVGMNNFTGINWDWRLPGRPDQRGEFNEPIPGFTPVMVGPQATINSDQSGWWRDLLKNTGYRPDSMPVEPIVTPRPEIQGPTISYNADTRFVTNVTVTDIKTGKAITGTIDLGPTLDRIHNNISYPHRNDGSTFKNNQGILPVQPIGYYTEYVVPTPSFQGVGPQRLVMGKNGEAYFTPDHYITFIPVK